MSFFVLTLDAESGLATLVLPADLGGGLEPFELTTGQSIAKQLKSNLLLSFDPDFPDFRKLGDLQPNSNGLFPVSARLGQILRAEPEVEFLPIRIADHRKKVVSDEYTLANFTKPVDCVDLTKSVYEMSSVDKAQADGIEKLVIDEKRVPAGRHVFRLKLRTTTVVVDQKLRDSIKAAKLKGVNLIPAEEFDSALYLGV